MLMPWDTLVAGHLSTEMCRRWAEQKLLCLAANTARVAVGTDLYENDQVLEKVDTFEYLGKILSFDDYNWSTMDQNLHIYKRKCGRLSCLFGGEGVDTRTS